MDINGGKSCSFFGHRKAEFNGGFDGYMESRIEQMILDGFTIFYFTWDSAFDLLCFEAVRRLKEKYAHILIVRCFADDYEMRRYKRYSIESGFDDCVTLPLEFDYWYTRLYYRNCALIDESDFCFFYVERTENSGAYKAMKHAIKTKKAFENLSPNKDEIV